MQKVDVDERKEGGKQTSLRGYKHPSEAAPSLSHALPEVKHAGVNVAQLLRQHVQSDERS